VIVQYGSSHEVGCERRRGATMGTAIGASLPYAVAAALSPVPITAVTLILLMRRGIASSLFAAGRVFSYAVLLTIVIVASELIRPGTDAAPSLIGVIARFAIGGAALGAGVWTWIRRSPADSSTAPSRWARAVDNITPARSAALGVVLSAGPKNLVLLAGGGLVVAGARLSWAGEAAAGVVFLGIASSTVLVPVMLYYAVGARALNALGSLQAWMQTNSATISTVLLILAGVVLIGSGITGL
jgi:hypothetical protein